LKGKKKKKSERRASVMIQHPNIYINDTSQTSSQSSFISSKERVMRNPIPLTVDGCDVPVGYSSDPCHFMIIKHVDVVWLYGIEPKYFDTIHNILIDMGFHGTDEWVNDPVYERQSRYSSDTDRTSIQILHKHRKKLPYKESMSIRVHDPSKDFAYTFHYNLTLRKLHYIVNYLELTFDFYTNRNATLKNFLDQSLYSHFRLSSKNTDEYSPYRSSTDGLHSKKLGKVKNYMVKLYHKAYPYISTRGAGRIRLELAMGRPPIRRHGFDLRLEGVDTIDLSRYFSFMRFDEKKLTDFYAGKPSSPLLPTDDIKEKRRRMNEGGLLEREYLSILAFSDPALLFKVAALKKMKFKNYNRFLTPFTEFQEIFDREIKKQTFLKPMDFSEQEFLFKPQVKLFGRH